MSTTITAPTVMTVGDVARRYQVSEQTITRWSRTGVLPPPVRLGARCVRWYLDVLVEADRLRTAHPDAPTAVPPPGWRYCAETKDQ